MKLILFEDDAVQNLLPLVWTKPVTDLVVGMTTLKAKVRRCFPENVISILARQYLTAVIGEMSDKSDFNNATLSDEDTLFLNARVVCDESFAAQKFQMGKAYFTGNDLVAFRTDKVETLFGKSIPQISQKALSKEFETVQIEATLVRQLWDLVRLHPAELRKELAASGKLGRIEGAIGSGVHLINEKNIFVEEGAVIKSGAVLDADGGAIYISRNATVLPNVVLMNTIFLDENSVVKIGAKIYDNVSIGRFSKVGGEVEDSIIEQYANKQHDGFLGHSYLSSWCNLGADTNTSDLKNNYGNVRCTIGDKEHDTKMMFLGLLMAEHSKSGINTMFNTGTVVGVSSNIYGSGFPQKFIGSFQWGGAESGFVPFEFDKALQVAKAVMQRRNVMLTPAYQEMLRSVWQQSSLTKL
jgi:UDP-N-acetylglucosamine diphosphorylase/glucosamine-1-phosphate N-acetyltransferase